MSSNTGYVMTLANAIIGVSLLAMPYCFKQCGILLAILMLIVSNMVTRTSCYFLVKSGMMARRKSCEFVAFHAFGSSGKFLVELGVIGFMLGTCVAYFVVIGDLAPSILSKMFSIPNSTSLRSIVLLGVTVVMIIPLTLLRNIQSLAAISTLSVIFYALLAIRIFSESTTHLIAADWLDYVVFWRTEGILQCFPIFSTALACQTQIFEILEVLPNPTTDRMNDIMKSAVNMCTCLYITVGFLGYVAFSQTQFGGNILLSFAPSLSSDLFQLGFVLSVAVSFPCVIFPCRASLHSMLFKKGYHELNNQTMHIPDSQFKCLTFTIVSIALTIGLLIPTIEIVLGFVGSTIGVATCIVFPAGAFIQISNKETSERLLAKVLLLIGLFTIILGTFGNLRVYSSIEAFQLTKVLPVKPTPVIEQPKLNIAKNPIVNIEKVVSQTNVKESEIIPDKQLPKELNLVKPVNDIKRQEPPIPLAPADIVQKPNLIEKPVAVPAEKPQSQQGENEKLQPEVIKKAQDEKTIDQDAIEKDIKERKADDNQQKLDETKKQEELLKKLEEHKKEQKQLLEEQQHILNEIKNRGQTEKPVKPIKTKEFDEKIEKIQEVIDDLKERKQIIDKANSDKIAKEKLKAVDRKEKKIDKESTEKNITENAEQKKAEPIIARDILQVQSNERVKRDTEKEEHCYKNKEPIIIESKIVSPPEKVNVNIETIDDAINKPVGNVQLDEKKTKKRK